MSHILTLVAAPDHEVDATVVDAAHDVLDGFGLSPVTDWLSPGSALDMAMDGAVADVATVDAALRVRLAGTAVDHALLPGRGRRKRLLVADMDSTIIDGETLDELAAEAGLKERVAAITARAMNGEIDFKAALRERVGLLRGLPIAALDRTLARVALNPGARTLVRTMRAHGARTMLVSGGFDFFTGRVRDMAGFQEDAANELEVEHGLLTGRVREPILDRDAKVDALRRGANAAGIEIADTVAVGDGANDLPMLQLAGLGVAWRAKPTVAAAARVRVDHADLTALLYFQGYRQAELVD